MKGKNKIWILSSVAIIIILFIVFMIPWKTPLPTEEVVDLEKYSGTWYSIYEYPAWFQQGCECTQANYKVMDGYVEVINTCFRNSAYDSATGKAEPLDETNSILGISFSNFPFAVGNYYIIDVSNDYEYALVGTPDRRYLWILSREPNIPENVYNEYIELSEELGFDSNKLIKVNHNGC